MARHAPQARFFLGGRERAPLRFGLRHFKIDSIYVIPQALKASFICNVTVAQWRKVFNTWVTHWEDFIECNDAPFE